MEHLPADLFTVGELTYRIKEILECDADLQEIQVQGEVSNLTIHGSGHAYFTLKDEDAQISCVLFRQYLTAGVRSVLAHGASLVAEGSVTVYAQRGNYQLMVRGVRAAGVGDLYRQFVQLKEWLQGEGLFDAERKRPLPAFPETIGVVTSPTGAVIRDILQTLQRRYPCVQVRLSPAVVQGEQGAASVRMALQRLVQTSGIDVIIIARGGGSMEDLWCFNDEQLARAVAGCPIPVISAIGHETDFTILDFVADVRAATPTAAAECAVPDQRELVAWLSQSQTGVRLSVHNRLYATWQWLDDVTERLHLQRNHLLQQQRSELRTLHAQLQVHNPRHFLEKGYSVILKDGRTVTSANELRAADSVELVLKDGRRRATID